MSGIERWALYNSKVSVVVVRVIIPSSVTLNPQQTGLAEAIKILPPCSGIYALSAPGKPPHISWSANLPRRLMRLLVSSYTDSRVSMARLRENLVSVDCWPTGSRLETALLLYELTKRAYPEDYAFRLRLRIPWFIGLTNDDPFPRLTVLNRVSRKAGPLFGPFANRELAQRYEEEVLGLFQVRRCTEVLAPHPEHPGCIYGEMNLCMRPCQSVVSTHEYATEAARVADFLANNGRTVLSALTSARDRAAESTDFEQAAQIHKRIERVRATADLRNDVVAQVQSFRGVALTRGPRHRQVYLWPMIDGYWQEPVILDFPNEEAKTSSLDRDLRERLSASLAEPRLEGKRAEELAIFSRWYFASWRDGSWFPFRSLADLNYRRLVREISAMLKPESASC